MKTFLVQFRGSRVYKIIAGNAIDAMVGAITEAAKEAIGYSVNDVTNVCMI